MTPQDRVTVRPRGPQGVTAVLDNGLRVPCAVRPDGMSEGLPKYRIVAEIDWRTYQIERVEIKWWPDNVCLALDLGLDVSDQELIAYAARVRWVDMSGWDN